MEDIKKLLNRDILKEISREADGDLDADDVAKVLNAVMPQLEERARSGELSRSGAEAERGGVTDLLPLLLGGNSAGVADSVSESTGVSGSSVNSILKIAAPILLYMLLKDDDAPQQQGGGMNLLGALLGGGQPQQQQNAGMNLLGSLLGGSQPQQQQNVGMNLLGSLLGGGQPQQQQQPSSPDLLGTLFSILGDSGK